MLRFPRVRIPFFRIFYSSTYSALLLLTLLLLVVTPVDQIYQTLSNGKFGNAIVIGAVWVTTAIITLFIYASRLYTNRTALATIPKSYLPVQRKEIHAPVRRVIVKNRERSALIAWDSRPRDLRQDPGAVQRSGGGKHEKHTRDAATYHASLPLDPATTSTAQKAPLPTTIIPIDPASPPWGPIAHPGWSSPAVSRYGLPEEVRFETVVAELPHLIEAAAVALAPPDPAFHFLTQTLAAGASASPDDVAAATSSDGTSSSQKLGGPPPASAPVPMPAAPHDPRAVALLQRGTAMGLRGYLGQLAALGVLGGAPAARMDAFVARYEYARFSAHALTEDEFAGLMAAFVELLEGLQPVREGWLQTVYGDGMGEHEGVTGYGAIVGGETTAGASAGRRRARRMSERSEASSVSVVRHFAQGSIGG